MAPQFLFDISRIDLGTVSYGPDVIEKINPHRGNMRLLDGIIHINDAIDEAVAYHDVRDDEFWVEGHIPGRPLFPGVLMIEAAAQLASYITLLHYPDVKFIGFAGVDNVKFRGQVVPGDRMLVLGKALEFRRRRSTCNSQCLVNGKVVFEAKITGMPI